MPETQHNSVIQSLLRLRLRLRLLLEPELTDIEDPVEADRPLRARGPRSPRGGGEGERESSLMLRSFGDLDLDWDLPR